MGTAKAELKLLACQRADLTWNALPRDELIVAPTEEVNNLNDGALVLAELNPSRQVQKIQEAGRLLASFLHNLSRQLEKSKSQEEEIAQWKQSLSYQSQQLNSRQTEMEARWEQLQQLEASFEQLEGQKQEIDCAQEQIQQLRAEVERQRQELEGAWEHLRGEQRLLTEQKTLQGGDEKTGQIQELIICLERAIPIEALRLELDLSFEMVATQHSLLLSHWQQLEQQRYSVTGQQEEVDSIARTLENRKMEWQQVQNSIVEAKLELQTQTSALMSKREQAQLLRDQLRYLEELYQQIEQQVGQSDSQDANTTDSALEQMPLEQLQQTVQTYTSILQKAEQFVGEQEEELRFVQQTITELQVRLQQGNDRLPRLEMELAEEQDRYQMLNETLVGQRQNLREREETLTAHRAVLLRRQGNTPYDLDRQRVNIAQILGQIQQYKEQKFQELQELEQQTECMGANMHQALEIIAHQAQEQEMQHQDLQSFEQNLMSQRMTVAGIWGRINLYQEMLQPVQDSLDGLQQRLETLANSLDLAEDVSNQHRQTIARIQQAMAGELI